MCVCVYMRIYELGFVGSHNHQTKYTTCGERVLSSKLLCVSMALKQWHYITNQQSARTHSLIMYTSKCPIKTAYTASLPWKVSTEPSGGFSALACFYFWQNLLTESRGFQQVVRKQSIKIRTTASKSPVGARWGLQKVQTDQSLPLMSQRIDQTHQTPHCFP